MMKTYFKFPLWTFIFYGLTLFSLDSFCGKFSTVNEIFLNQDDADEASSDYRLSIRYHADSFVSGVNTQIRYRIYNDYTNRVYTLPYPAGHEKEMTEVYVEDQIKFRTNSIPEYAKNNIRKYTSYSDEDIKNINAFITGTKEQKLEAFRNLDYPTLRATMLIKSAEVCAGTCNNLSMKDLAGLLAEMPGSIDGAKVNWDYIDFSDLSYSEKTAIMNSITIDPQAIQNMTNAVCADIDAAGGILNSTYANALSSLTLKQALDSFNIFSEYGVDPASTCKTGNSLGMKLIALQKTALKSSVLTDEQKKEIEKLLDKHKISKQLPQYSEVNPFGGNIKCDSLKNFFGVFKLCDLSAILNHLSRNASKNTKKGTSTKNTPSTYYDTHNSEKCTVESMYQVNARVIQKGRVRIIEKATGKEEFHELNGMSLEEYQNQIQNAYKEALEK